MAHAGAPVRRVLRRAAFPVVLAVRRLRARLAQALVVALGFVVGSALVATAVAGSTAVRDGAVERELARLGPSRTSIQAVWSGVPAQSDAAPATLDKQAKSALREIVGGRRLRSCSSGKRASAARSSASAASTASRDG